MWRWVLSLHLRPLPLKRGLNSAPGMLGSHSPDRTGKGAGMTLMGPQQARQAETISSQSSFLELYDHLTFYLVGAERFT